MGILSWFKQQYSSNFMWFLLIWFISPNWWRENYLAYLGLVAPTRFLQSLYALTILHKPGNMRFTHVHSAMPFLSRRGAKPLGCHSVILCHSFIVAGLGILAEYSIEEWPTRHNNVCAEPLYLAFARRTKAGMMQRPVMETTNRLKKSLLREMPLKTPSRWIG